MNYESRACEDRMYLKPQQLVRYQETLQQRQTSAIQRLAQRRQRSWVLAEQASRLLKEAYGVEQVMVFGSLVHQHWFTMTSDIDLAVWGLNHEDYFTAVAKLQDLDPEFEIDLIRMESCREALKEIIPQEGKML